MTTKPTADKFTSPENLHRLIAFTVRNHREFGTPVAELRDLLSIFCANWLAGQRGESVYDFDEFIAENRAVIEPMVKKALRHYEIGGAR